MAGFAATKPRRRASHKVQLAAGAQKKHGRVGTETVLGAGKRSSRRAKDPQSMETVQRTLQEVDVTTQKRLADWEDRENSVDVLRDEIDPQYGRAYALQTAALRADADLDQYTVRVAESEAGVAANVLSRKAGAALKKEKGHSKTYTLRRIGARGVRVCTQKVTLTGEQVQEKARRKRKLEALPPELRPTFETQTLTPGSGLFKSKTPLPPPSKRVKSTHTGARKGPPSKRSRAEINAKAQRVTGPYARGTYQMKIPMSQFSGRALRRMGFPKKNGKPNRFFYFKGPTAKDDARAFDKKLMGWIEKWKKGVGPPPQP
jgi:hypothetical protein